MVGVEAVRVGGFWMRFGRRHRVCRVLRRGQGALGLLSRAPGRVELPATREGRLWAGVVEEGRELCFDSPQPPWGVGGQLGVDIGAPEKSRGSVCFTWCRHKDVEVLENFGGI